MENLNEKARIQSAKNLARNLIKKSKINEAPVSLRTVIAYLQSSYNLNVYASPNFTDKLSAILVTIEDDTVKISRNEIHYNENHNWHRRRFSIAHEIGHLLFNTSCGSSGLDVYNSVSPNEAEANQFASELLMPVSFLKSDLKKSRTNIKDLAWKYIVSEEAMGWKIANNSSLIK